MSELSDHDVGVMFQKMQMNLNQRKQVCQEHDAELQEHELVIKTLAPFDKERKCFKLIGGVLVERTVGEVLPEVQSTADNLRKLLETEGKQMMNLEKQLQEFVQKNNIRIRPPG